MPTVLHVLPHPGGGAETYIDLLEGLAGYSHRRLALSVTRSRGRGVPSVLARRQRVLRLADEVDLVHLHGDMAAMLIGPALGGRGGFDGAPAEPASRSLGGRPLLITSHGLHRLRRSRGAVAWLVRRRLRAAVAASARTICIARDERRDLAAALPAALHERLVVVPNGVAPVEPDPQRRARARAALGLGEGQVTALFAGQLERRKDPLGAIAAVEAARARGADLTLLLAGGGRLEAEVRAAASAAQRPPEDTPATAAGGASQPPGAKPRPATDAAVQVLGHRDDLNDLYAAADLFLLPSHREGMSFALLEAMAHGLAPLVADGPGNAETAGEAGVLFPPGDVAAMAARLAELASDPGARARLGAAARQRIATELSLERFLAGTREQYEAALAAGAVAGAG